MSYISQSIPVNMTYHVVFTLPLFGDIANVSISRVGDGLGEITMDFFVGNALLNIGDVDTVLCSLSFRAYIPKSTLVFGEDGMPNFYLPATSIGNLIVTKDTIRLIEDNGNIKTLLSNVEVAEYYEKILSYIRGNMGRLVRCKSQLAS